MLPGYIADVFRGIWHTDTLAIKFCSDLSRDTLVRETDDERRAIDRLNLSDFFGITCTLSRMQCTRNTCRLPGWL